MKPSAQAILAATPRPMLDPERVRRAVRDVKAAQQAAARTAAEGVRSVRQARDAVRRAEEAYSVAQRAVTAALTYDREEAMRNALEQRDAAEQMIGRALGMLDVVRERDADGAAREQIEDNEPAGNDAPGE